MLKWFRRKETREEPTYCGFILMQSEWYKKRVEDGLIDHSDTLAMVFQEDRVAELEALGNTNVQFVDLGSRKSSKPIQLRLPSWVQPETEKPPAK